MQINTISRIVMGTLLVSACLLPGRIMAAEAVLPSVVAAGLEAYKAAGAQAAFASWLKGSPLEGDKQAQSQSAMLVQIETFYGKFVSATPLGVFEPSPGTTLIFVGLKYEKGPVFAKFMTFRAAEKEFIVALKFHTEAEEILPSQLLYKSK